jgi:hypothetical protein
MKWLVITFVVTIALVSCGIDEARNAEQIRIAKRHYADLEFDRTIFHCRRVPSQSIHASEAAKWTAKSNEAKDILRRLRKGEELTEEDFISPVEAIEFPGIPSNSEYPRDSSEIPNEIF